MPGYAVSLVANNHRAPNNPEREPATVVPCVSLVEELAIYKLAVQNDEILLREQLHSNHNSRPGQIIHWIRIIINQEIIIEIILKPIDENSVWQSLMMTCTMRSL